MNIWNKIKNKFKRLIIGDDRFIDTDELFDEIRNRNTTNTYLLSASSPIYDNTPLSRILTIQHEDDDLIELAMMDCYIPEEYFESIKHDVLAMGPIYGRWEMEKVTEIKRRMRRLGIIDSYSIPEEEYHKTPEPKFILEEFLTKEDMEI